MTAGHDVTTTASTAASKTDDDAITYIQTRTTQRLRRQLKALSANSGTSIQHLITTSLTNPDEWVSIQEEYGRIDPEWDTPPTADTPDIPEFPDDFTPNTNTLTLNLTPDADQATADRSTANLPEPPTSTPPTPDTATSATATPPITPGTVPPINVHVTIDPTTPLPATITIPVTLTITVDQ